MNVFSVLLHSRDTCEFVSPCPSQRDLFVCLFQNRVVYARHETHVRCVRQRWLQHSEQRPSKHAVVISDFNILSNVPRSMQSSPWPQQWWRPAWVPSVSFRVLSIIWENLISLCVLVNQSTAHLIDYFTYYLTDYLTEYLIDYQARLESSSDGYSRRVLTKRT